jgi:TPP-dependent pyruvate/acetoin dehydrogenase alpha subunit
MAQELADAATLEAWRAEVESEMNAAVEFAIAAPYPSPSEAAQDVYA